MRRKFNGALAVLTIAAAAVALSGCSPSGGQKDGVTTVRMVNWPGPEGTAIAHNVKTYNATQGKKDKIKVDLILLSRQDTFSKETALMASKSNDIDIYFTGSYNVGQYAGALEPLTGIDTKNYFQVAVKGVTYQNKLLGLPLDTSIQFLYYRTDLIQALLSDPSKIADYKRISSDVVGKALQPTDPQKTPWSLDDYKAMSAYFSTSTNPASPTQYGTALQAKNLVYNTFVWDDILWGYGGGWTKNGKAAIDTDAGRKAIALYADIYKNKWTSPNSAQAEYPETQAALQAGNVATAIQWSAAYTELNDKTLSPQIAGKIGIAPVPGGKTSVSSTAISLNKYAQHKDAAKTWLKYLTTEEAMTEYAKAGGAPPMPKVLNALKDFNPTFAQEQEDIAKHGFSEPVFPQAFPAFSKLAEDLSGAWVGQTAVDQAAKQANQNLQALLP